MLACGALISGRERLCGARRLSLSWIISLLAARSTCLGMIIANCGRMRAMDNEPDCRTCGACCSMRWSWPVLRRDRADAVGIPAWMQRRDYPLLCSNGDRCVALCGRVGALTWCGIYEVRPDACRRFSPGSALCLEARAKHGLSENLKSEI